jgi:septal ring factor EnvC (AmiA/AmiB activator)
MRRVRFLLAALSLAVAGAVGSADSGAAPAGDTAANIDRLLAALTREEQQSVRRFEELGLHSERSELRALSRGRAYVRLARAGLLPIGSGFSAFLEHAARLERLRRGIEKDLAEHRRAQKERVALGQRIEELRARRGPLEAEHEAILQAESALRSAEEREQAFQRAFSGAASGNDHTAVYGGIGADSTADGDPRFAAQKARLPFPLAGRSEVQREKREASSGAGLAMRARVGTEVRAVHVGRVAFADSVADYGKAVIVDHGDGYYTLSGNLGTVEVVAGDEVGRGARLGTVGDAPGGALLYFEIRHGTDTLDPAAWLGID